MSGMTLPDDASSATTRRDGDGSSAAHSTFRLASILSLVLALAFVIAVIVAARMVMLRQIYTDVAMGPVDSPDAQSPACSSLIETLPGQAGDFRQVGVVDPAPDGAAAFRNSQGTELALRCGVNTPDQYTVLSHVTDEEGVRWLQVADTTEGSSLRTWYAVGATPVVALTTEANFTTEDRRAFAESLTAHTSSDQAPQPNPWPLSQIPAETSKAEGTKKAEDTTCRELLDNLAQKDGSRESGLAGYQRVSSDQANTISQHFGELGKGAHEPENSVSFVPRSEGSEVPESSEPIVVRCGVALPESYEIGARLSQVGGVAWFSDARLAQGSTAGIWYAISHEHVVALSMPADAGNEVITSVSQAIEATMDSVETPKGN